MDKKLPEVIDKVKDVVNVDRGNVFPRRSLFPVSQKRLEVQEKIYTVFLECNKETSLAKIGAEKELRKFGMEIESSIKLAEMDCTIKIQELKFNAFLNFCNMYNLDPDDAKDLFEKLL